MHAEVNSFLEDPEKYLGAAKAAGDHTARTNLEAVADCLGASRCKTFEDCIALSRRQFEVRRGPACILAAKASDPLCRSLTM